PEKQRIIDEAQVRTLAHPFVGLLGRPLLLQDLAGQRVADVRLAAPGPDADVLLVAQQAPDVVVMPSRRGGAVVLGSVEPGEFAGNPVQALLLLDKPPEHPADPLSVFLVDDDAFARPGVAAPASLLAVGDRLGGVAQPPVAD